MPILTCPPVQVPRRAPLTAWLVLWSLGACGSEPDLRGLPEPLARHQAADPTAASPEPPPLAASPEPPLAAASPERPAARARPPAPIGSCEALRVAAAHQPADAAILLELCPDAPTSAEVLRHALLMADSPAAAAALLPRLAAAPELAGLARLVALERPATPVLELPEPASAVVNPVGDEVLAAVQLALRQQTDAGLAQDQRTRAAAYLARVHHEALLQLGLPPGQLPPLARVLAGRFLHFGRELSRMYWQRRVTGLEQVFASTELQLLRVVLALERSPHLADDALLAVEHQRSRRHLQGSAIAGRISRTLEGLGEPAPSPDDLLPLAHEFDRLFDHRFIELVIQRALYLAGEQPGAYGVTPVAEMLREQLAARDLQAYAATLEQKIADARALNPAPPEQGAQMLPARVVLAWPGEAAVADEADAWLQIAAPAADLTRRHALARASLLLRERPDAARLLLRRALEPGRPPDPLRVGLLLDLLARLDDESLAGLRLSVAARPYTPGDDDALRRAHALAASDAGLIPR